MIIFRGIIEIYDQILGSIANYGSWSSALKLRPYFSSEKKFANAVLGRCESYQECAFIYRTHNDDVSLKKVATVALAHNDYLTAYEIFRELGENDLAWEISQKDPDILELEKILETDYYDIVSQGEGALIEKASQLAEFGLKHHHITYVEKAYELFLEAEAYEEGMQLLTDAEGMELNHFIIK